MHGKYLLDTSAAIRVLNDPRFLAARPDDTSETFLCLTVLGELLFGAANSMRPGANRNRVLELLRQCPLVDQDFYTAAHYGEIKASLRKRGRPIPDNDLWIAACALQYGLILATRDRHFDHVDGLNTETW